jgi:cell division transport system permease protein
MNSFFSALIQIRRSPYQSMAALLLLTLTFFVGYVFSMLLTGSEIVLSYFETKPQVIAFFEVEAEKTELDEVIQDLQKTEYVSQIKVITKEDALNAYQEENKDNPLLLELVTSEILPASIEVSGKSIEDLTQIKEFLDEYDQVDEVVLQQDIIDSLSAWTRNLRFVGIATVAVLGLVSLLTMVIIIGMKVVGKRPAIKIMRLIGATKWFIKSPFVFEGVVYGLVSSLLGWGLSLAVVFYTMPYIKEFLGEVATQVFPIPPEFLMVQVAVGSLIGILLGGMAGSISVGRMIKR